MGTYIKSMSWRYYSELKKGVCDIVNTLQMLSENIQIQSEYCPS